MVGTGVVVPPPAVFMVPAPLKVKLKLMPACVLLPASVGLQGNLPPSILTGALAGATAAETTRLLEVMRERKGYIFNLGHGVPPDAKLENIAALVETVKKFK